MFGWPDFNLLMHAERTNKLSSVFLSHLDLLDDLDEIKICTGYKRFNKYTETTESVKGILPGNVAEYRQM